MICFDFALYSFIDVLVSYNTIFIIKAILGNLPEHFSYAFLQKLSPFLKKIKKFAQISQNFFLYAKNMSLNFLTL